MVPDYLQGQERKKNETKGREGRESKGDSFNKNYECSMPKDTVPVKDGVNKCDKSTSFLESDLYEHSNIRSKKELSNLNNTAEARKCLDKENDKVNADTTSQMALKSYRHSVKHYVSDSQIRTHKIKLDHKMKKRKKYLLDKKERSNSLFANKKLNTSSSKEVLINNSSEIIAGSNSKNTMHIPVQIDREKIKSSLELRLCEKEDRNSKTFYYKSQTMEADSTVSNDKKENELKDVVEPEVRDVEPELSKSLPACQFQDSSDISTISNQKFLNLKERKRKKIEKKFRILFNECLTLSEEEEEICILDSQIHKKRKKDSNDSWNDSTNIESHNVSYSQTEDQDTISNLGICKDITNEIVSTNTCKTDESIKESKTMSNIASITEYNNNEIFCDNNLHASQSELCPDENIYLEKIVKSPQLENNKQIENDSSENNLLNSESNTEEKNAEETSKLKNSTDLQRDTLRDSNINDDSNNDTSIEVLTNCAIKIITSRENNNNSDNFNEINNSDGSDITTEIINPTSDSTSPVEEILEKSKNTDDHSKTSQDVIIMKGKSAIIAMENENEITPYAATFAITQKSSEKSNNNMTDNISKSSQQHENVGEDLTKLLQMDINRNYHIQCNGNAISIAECLDKDTDKENSAIAIDYSVSKAKETCVEQSSTTLTALKENISIFNNQNKDNVVENISLMVPDTSKQHTLLESNTKHMDNFKEPESIKPNKIRVLSSAELGSRWCPTPVSDPVLKSVTEPNLSHAIAVSTNESEPSENIIAEPTSALNNSNTDTQLKINPNSRCIEMCLLCIWKRIMHIRLIENNYLSNEVNGISTGNKKTISNDLRFKSHVFVLLEEFDGLQKELKKANMNQVIQYAVTAINKYFISNQWQPISIEEIIRYMKSFNSTKSEMTRLPVCTNTPVTNEQGTNRDSIYTTPIKHVSTVPNNANMTKVTSSVSSNVHVPVMPQVPTTNNLLKQNIHTSNISNQNHDYNISNLQATQMFSGQILCTPLVQQTSRIIQVPQENRTPSTYMPYYQYIIQQQPTPIVKTNNVPNINMIQLNNNIYSAQKVNLQQNSQENLARNKAECPSYGTFLPKDQYNIPQKLAQQNIPYNVPQRPQINIMQNSLVPNITKTQVSYSTALPTQSTYPTHSQNLPPGTSTIPHELILKIWDQVTFCLDTNVFDCRLHERSDKADCFLRIFYTKWKAVIHNIIYKKLVLQCNERIILRSRRAKHLYNALLAWHTRRVRQPPMTHEKVINQSESMKTLNKTIINNNLVLPVNIESQNVAIQPEIPQHESQSDKNNVELETQQKSPAQSDLQLEKALADRSTIKENAINSKADTPSTVSKKNDSLFIESNHTKLDNTSFTSNKTDNINVIDVTASTSDQMSHLENDDIEILEVLHIKEKNSLSEHITREKVMHVKEENLLPEEVIEKEVHMKDISSLPKETITEEVYIKKESSLDNQIIEEEILHVEEDSSLTKETVRDNTDHPKCDMIPNVTLCEPHITDVRSISPTCFNAPEDICVQNYVSSSTSQSIENKDIKITIEIPEDIICLQCSKTSTVVCEVCLEAYYCSETCAKSHWILEHHKYCKPYCEQN